MKKRLFIVITFLALLMTSLSLLSYSDFLINIVSPNTITTDIEEGDKSVCYIGDIEFTSLDRALEYASSDSNRNDIVVIPGTNPSINRVTSLSKEDYLYIPFRDMNIELTDQSSVDQTPLNQQEAGIMEYAWVNESTTNDISGFTNTSKVTVNTDFTIYGKLYVGATLYSYAGPLSEKGFGQPYANFIHGDYASFDLNGHNVTVSSGASVYGYGLLTDTSSSNKGQIELVSEGSLLTDFCVEDYRGGTVCSNKYFKNETPFLLYKLPYILCDIKVNYGSTLYGNCCLYANLRYNATIQVIFGNNGLIELESGYLIHKNIDSSVESYKEQIDVYGNIKTNAMNLSVSSITVSTSCCHFPITKYLNFNIYDGSIVTLNGKYKFLPGSEVNFYDNSSLIVNGEVSLYETFKSIEELELTSSQKPFYPDYGTYDPSFVKFNDNASLTINDELLNDGNIDYYPSIAGRVIFAQTNVQKDIFISSFQNKSNNTYYIQTSEGIGNDGNKIYLKLYDYYNYLIYYESTSNSNKLLYKRFSNYYFEYIYDETNTSTLTEVDMKTLNGTVIAKKENIDTNTSASWNILTESSSFIDSKLTDELLDTAISIDVGNNVKVVYSYDGSKEYYVLSNGTVINYGSGTINVTVYDSEKEIYTDGDNYYAALDGDENYVIIQLYELDMVAYNTFTRKYYYFLDDNDEYLGESTTRGWYNFPYTNSKGTTSYNLTYNKTNHYLQVKYDTNDSSSTAHYYIINEDDEGIIKRVQLYTSIGKLGNLPFVGYKDSSTPSFAYIEGVWESIEGGDINTLTVYKQDSTGEKREFGYFDCYSHYLEITNFKEAKENTDLYIAKLAVKQIFDDNEYNLAFLVTQYASYGAKSNKYWKCARINKDNNVSKIVYDYYAKSTHSEYGLLPLYKDNSYLFLGYAFTDILENYNENGVTKFLYNNSPFTYTDNILAYKYAIKSDESITLFDDSIFYIYKNDDDSNIYIKIDNDYMEVTKTQGVYFYDNSIYWVNSSNLYSVTYNEDLSIKSIFAIAKNKFTSNIKLSKHEKYDLYYGNASITSSGKTTNYLIYAVILSDDIFTFNASSSLTDINDIIKETTDDSGDTIHTIDFYLTNNKTDGNYTPTTFTLTESS